jgi:hypothetical protein
MSQYDVASNYGLDGWGSVSGRKKEKVISSIHHIKTISG